MTPSCALLGGFAIGARVALLWQHNANPSYKCEREMLASALYSLYAYFYTAVDGCQNGQEPIDVASYDKY